MKIETKYDIGQEVWATNFGNLIRGLVTEINIYVSRNEVMLLYMVCFGGRPIAVTESGIFPSKEELLKSFKKSDKQLK